MNKKLLTLTAVAATMGALSSSAQTIVAGWDTWNNTPANQANGVTATRGTTTVFNLDSTLNGSPDGTFGTFAGANTSTANVQDAMSIINGADGSIEFTITENTGTAIDLGFFHVDLRRLRFGSAENWDVSILAGGGLTAGSIGSGALGVQAPPGLLMTDIDLDLSGLADFNLGIGESVTFLVSLTGGNGASGQHSYLDNVAITSAVPEPSTYALLAGIVSLGFAATRRRK